MKAYHELEKRFQELSCIEHAEKILAWDEAVMMPGQSFPSRHQALSYLSGHYHERLTRSDMKGLLSAAEQESLSDWQRTNVVLMDKQYRQATCLPKELVEAISQSRSACENAWRQCRAKNDWQQLLPLLEKVFQLTRESATIQSQAFSLSPYDILLDYHSPGLTQSVIDPLFDSLKQQLPSLIKKAVKQQQSALPPEGPFPVDLQMQLCQQVMSVLGFDHQKGRLDTSHHPFCGGTARDVRITTRYDIKQFSSSLMGVCHETGHALYEQQLPESWLSQPVGRAYGMAVHESQSLFVEMQLCRSDAFLTFMAQQLRQTFGDQPAFDEANLIRLYRQVQPGLIRVYADELTYPMHVILRYEIERDLFAGEIAMSDLPAVWDEKMKQYLQLSTDGNDSDGVMQDVHWPSGSWGYFPAYTIGRLIASQLFESASHSLPSLDDDLGCGDFQSIRHWLKQHVHSKGSSLTLDQLLVSATGSTLQPTYFIDHIKQRYFELD